MTSNRTSAEIVPLQDSLRSVIGMGVTPSIIHYDAFPAQVNREVAHAMVCLGRVVFHLTAWLLGGAADGRIS